jgi:hypoxanthine phosphoribosyltransferase
MNIDNFPEQARAMNTKEAEKYFKNMVCQIDDFKPNEIIAVARSGFSYAMWTSQLLKLPLGAYWPKINELVTNSDPERIVFVDDNILQGSTYLATKKYMATYWPTVEWRWAVLFSDWQTPEDIRNEIIQGVRLPYFAHEPIWGSMKVSKGYGIRFRDEDSI